MENKYKILAIIPARGGSKRVPEKNIRNLAGRPLIAYTIEHSKSSKYINRVIVSTDSEDIARVAREYGAETPFLRPLELAQDNTPDFPVFEHALAWLKENDNYVPDVIVQLRPTSPLREVADVDAAIELLLAHPEADSVRTVIEPQSSPYKMYRVAENGFVEPLMRSLELASSPDQKLPHVYRHIGTADVIWAKTLLGKKHISGENILPLVVKKAYSGINTTDDWQYYEFLFSQKKQ